MLKKTFFFQQSFICSDYAQLCQKIEEYVNKMELQGYNYENYNIVDTKKCDNNWVKYQLIVVFKRSDR